MGIDNLSQSTGTDNNENFVATGGQIIFALAGNDTLSGSGNYNVLVGGSGADTFLWSPGAIIWADSGNDTVHIDSTLDDLSSYVVDGSHLSIQTNSGIILILNYQTASIQQLVFNDGTILYSDVLAEADWDGASGWDGWEEEIAGDGSSEADYRDMISTYANGPISDDLSGGAGEDVISGSDNADTIAGGGGADTLQGGGGADFINGDDGADTISGGGGKDTISGGKGDDTLSGGGGSDRIYGGTGDDLAIGDNGADVIYGSLGNDTLKGGNGVDTASYKFAGAPISASLTDGVGTAGQAAGDIYDQIENLTGGKRNDTLEGDEVDNVITGYGGSDTLYGQAGDDQLFGSGGDDLLFGGSGDDILNGGRKSDTLSGGAGNDTLTGGTHADVFVFEQGGGHDVITDFRVGQDTLDISSFGFQSVDEVIAVSLLLSGGLFIEFDDMTSITIYTQSGNTIFDLNTLDIVL